MPKAKKENVATVKSNKKVETVKEETVDNSTMSIHNIPENIKEEMSNTIADMANMELENDNVVSMEGLMKTLTELVNNAMDEVRARQDEIMKGINDINDALKNQGDKNVDYMEMLRDKLSALDTVEDTLEQEINEANDEIHGYSKENEKQDVFNNGNKGYWSGVKTT